jgi:cytochrome c oxidase subunit IV
LVWKVDKILTFTERAQNAVDVTSTFVQVLIGLSSVIIAAVLAFYPNIASIEDINFSFLKFSLIMFGVSTVSGLLTYCALIGVVDWVTKACSPAYSGGVLLFVFIQLASFAIALVGMLYLIIELPVPSVQVANIMVKDAVESLKNNNTSVA